MLFRSAVGASVAGNTADPTSFKKSATKMRNQCVENLKLTQLPKADVDAILASIESIDELIQTSHENPAAAPAMVRFMDMFRRGKMDARSSSDYNDKLEALVSNELFVQSAKLGNR